MGCLGLSIQLGPAVFCGELLPLGQHGSALGARRIFRCGHLVLGSLSPALWFASVQSCPAASAQAEKWWPCMVWWQQSKPQPGNQEHTLWTGAVAQVRGNIVARTARAVIQR